MEGREDNLNNSTNANNQSDAISNTNAIVDQSPANSKNQGPTSSRGSPVHDEKHPENEGNLKLGIGQENAENGGRLSSKRSVPDESHSSSYESDSDDESDDSDSSYISDSDDDDDDDDSEDSDQRKYVIKRKHALCINHSGKILNLGRDEKEKKQIKRMRLEINPAKIIGMDDEVNAAKFVEEPQSPPQHND